MTARAWSRVMPRVMASHGVLRGFESVARPSRARSEPTLLNLPLTRPCKLSRALGLHRATAPVQDRLGVAGGLGEPLEDQVVGGGERLAVVRRAHRHGSPVAGLLLVDHVGHPAERLLDLVGGDDAVVQPVGDVLGGDPAGGAVLHQRGAVDVGDLGAADAVVDPALHVAEDALEVVLDLGGPVLVGPVRRVASGTVSSSAERRRRRCRRAPPGARPRRPGGSAARAGWRRSATAPRRSWRRPSGGRSSARASRPSRPASPTCPCRSGPCRAKPHARPMSTFWSS